MNARNDDVRVLWPVEIPKAIRRLVLEARERVLLVSPFFRPWQQLESAILKSRKRDVDVTLVVRAMKVADETLAPYFEAGVAVWSNEEVHAKLYVSEKAAILTSMNLISSSATESWEAGVEVSRAAAGHLYDDIRDQAGMILEASAPVDPIKRSHASEELEARRTERHAAGSGDENDASGSCVRCAEDIPFDASRPLCERCFGSWRRYCNPEYEEGYCHECGRETETTYAHPLCSVCDE